MKKVIIILSIIFGLTSIGLTQNGLDFDGADDYVQTSYAGALGSSNRTFEAWIYIPSSAPSSNLAIMDYGLNAVGSRNTFSISGNRGLIFISGGTNANISTPTNLIPLNQWTHVAFVLDNGTGYLYIDGVQMGTGSLTTVNTPANNQNVRIGQRVSGGSIPFHGSLDEIRVWDIARTAAEIQASRNKEFCSYHPNLKLNLQFNEGIVGGNNTGITTAVDHSGHGNNGILNNFGLTGTTSNWVSGSGISDGNSTNSLQQTACNSFSLTPTSTVYTASGVYTEVLTGANAQGCDSTVILDLTINKSSSSTDMQTVCDSYTWIDGNTYTSNNNMATYTLMNNTGCDSVITLDLTIHTVDTSATQNGVMLMANAIGATYQWIECPAMTPISGATNQNYTATANGDYAVIVTDSLCSDTSSCYTVTAVSTIEQSFGKDILLFPNPTNGNFSIDMGAMYNTTTVTITDLNGKQILSNIYNNEQLLNLKLKEPSGVYLLIIESDNQKAIIRLVKK